MNQFKQLEGFGPSIHFGIDDKTYHADPALSYSGMKMLLESPVEYWLASAMNPHRTEFETDAMKAGKEFHTLLLEPDEFNKRYYITPVEPINQNKRMIRLTDYNEMKEAIRVLREMENFDLLLSGGYPEVAIFWRDPATGVMCRSKHDYFTPFYSSDYKTTDTLFDPYLRGKITRYGYNIQSVVYTESRMQIRQALLKDEAVIYGDVDPEFLRAFIKNDYDSFVFIWQKKKAPFAAQINPLSSHYLDKGERMARKAINTFVAYINKYGTDRWPVSDGRIRELAPFDDDLEY